MTTAKEIAELQAECRDNEFTSQHVLDSRMREAFLSYDFTREAQLEQQLSDAQRRLAELEGELAKARLESLTKQARDANIVDDCRSILGRIGSAWNELLSTLTAQQQENARLREAVGNYLAYIGDDEHDTATTTENALLKEIRTALSQTSEVKT